MEAMRRLLVLVLVLSSVAIVGASCGSGSPASDASAAPGAPASEISPTASRRPASFLSIRTASGRAATLHVDVADDDAERAQGLMGVKELPQDQGMAFVWDEPTSGTFWMKDTPLPLSIAFWDADGKVIALFDMQPCTTEPCPTYGPDEPFIGAVEANLGWFEEHGVAVGDHVELEERAYA